MPEADGVYFSQKLPKHHFLNEIINGAGTGKLRSYIGYQETADLITEATGVPIEVNRTEAELDDSDILLVIKLKNRPDPKDKGSVKPTIDDFEFRFVAYRKEFAKLNN